MEFTPMVDVDARIREIELNYAKLAESFLDLKQRVETHKEYCPLPEYKTQVKSDLYSMNTRFKNVLGILVTVLLVYLSGITYLYQNKTDNSSFENVIKEMKQAEIRRDERMQVITENQQVLQIKLLEEINSLKVEITKLSRNMGK